MLARRAVANARNFGKLSSNGPRWSLGYQMKWPIPKEGKFSPVFHEVSPAIEPPHSFFHTFRPIRMASASDKLTAEPVWPQAAMTKRLATANGPIQALNLKLFDG